MRKVAFYPDTNIRWRGSLPNPSAAARTPFSRAIRDRWSSAISRLQEFSSAMARRVRMREFTFEQAGVALSSFDAWLDRTADRVEIRAGDVALATTYLRRFDLTLRTPDALHIAIARRLDATLVAFDRGMVAAAGALGMAVATP